MEVIERDTLKQWMDEKRNFVLIESLPEKQFRAKHLPGAHNIPTTDERFRERVQQTVPDAGTPVVVYCADMECPASVKAAKELDELGYQQVYDYQAGKQDWEEAGLKLENEAV